MRLTTILFLLFISIAACKNEKHVSRNVTRGFYYWRSTFALDTIEKKALSDLNIKRLYIKFFDVAWQQGRGAVPIAQVKKNDAMPNTDIIPVVFIVNEVFRNMKDTAAVSALAGHIVQKINENTEGGVFKELQIDCDWSGTTRETYFLFLKQVKKRLENKTLSVTIRLHQFKNREKTGVPPADRGLLMPYNLLKVNDVNAKNSIFETDEAQKYFSKTPPYTLPLDLALPLFSWAVVYQENQYTTIFSEIDTKYLENAGFAEQIPAKEKTDAQLYKVNKDTVFRQVYLRRGDILKVEAINAALLEKIANLADPYLAHDANIIFFHLQNQILAKYENNTLEKTFRYLSH